MTVNFYTGPKFATPALFLHLLRPCKSFTVLTQFLPYIYKSLRPSTVVNHSPWSQLFLPTCSSFTMLLLPVNDLPSSCRGPVSLEAHTAHSQSCSGLDFQFSGVLFRSPCPPLCQHLLLIFIQQVIGCIIWT